MKSFGSTLILLLIVAVVGGYIYFNERGPIAETGAAVLLRTDPNSLSSVQLKQGNDQIVVLQKSGDTWNVQRKGKTDIPPVPADTDTVKTLLDQVQLVQSESVMPGDSAKLKEFGLDKPKSTLTVGDSFIEFGSKPSFDATKIYARVGSQIAVLSTALSDLVTKPFDDWRDKAVLRATVEDTKQFAVKAPAVTATFVKVELANSEASATWNIIQPVTADADTTTVEGLINQLPTTKTTKFLDDKPKNPAQWGLDKPLVTLKVTTKDGERTLLIGKKLKTGYAAQNSMSPSVFELADATYGLINRPLREWRSKNVVKLEIADLTQFEVTTRNATRAFTKNGEKWTSSGGAASTGSAATGIDAENQAVLDLIISLQNLNADNFIDKPTAPNAYGFDKPAVQFKLTSSKESAPIMVQLGVKDGKNYARTGTGNNFAPTVYVLPATAISGLQSPLDTLFPKPQNKTTPSKK